MPESRRLAMSRGLEFNLTRPGRLDLSPSLPSPSFLHLSFHFILLLSHNPLSLLGARMLQKKLSQSGAKLRLLRDLQRVMCDNHKGQNFNYGLTEYLSYP